MWAKEGESTGADRTGRMGENETEKKCSREEKRERAPSRESDRETHTHARARAHTHMCTRKVTRRERGRDGDSVPLDKGQTHKR